MAVFCAVLFAGGSALATMIQFDATIDGAQETPPNGSLAMAGGTFTMDTVANTLSVNVVITVPPPSGEISAHIHGFAPPGTPAGILFNLPVGSPKNAVWNFTEAQQGGIIASQTYVNIHSNGFMAGEIRGQVLPCASPATGCKSAGKSILLLKDNANNAKDKLLFKWLKGDATTLAELGVPTGTTNYSLCIYAGTAAIAQPADVPPIAGWSPIGTKGFKYKDKPGTNDGITKIVLKSGAAGKAKAIVKGKGVNLPDPTLGSLTLPVTAQLINGEGTCFEGVYNLADVIKNDATQFKAKAP